MIKEILYNDMYGMSMILKGPCLLILFPCSLPNKSSRVPPLLHIYNLVTCFNIFPFLEENILL